MKAKEMIDQVLEGNTPESLISEASRTWSLTQQGSKNGDTSVLTLSGKGVKDVFYLFKNSPKPSYQIAGDSLVIKWKS